MSDVHQVRTALGQRLRGLRTGAGLSGKSLAESLGWPSSKVSKIEHGKQTPTAEDITAWARACGAEDSPSELLSLLGNLETLYAEWQRILRAGTGKRQQTYQEIEASTRTLRVFESLLIPGLLQTPDYARVRLAENIELWGGVNDLDEGVRQRMRRQEILYDSSRRFYFVLSEAALRTLLCPPQVMAGQLERLIALSLSQTLKVGIIPFTTVLPISPKHGFWIYDDRLATAETVTAELHLTQPDEIEHYRRVFDAVSGVAHYGSDARQIITKALSDLAATLS
ncbi:helix-turn-helix transcriptional regulator [Nonomuraea sp. NPDC049129]|uniref:helix-turn-helix domain-containing protein n=1 Tax=Nonomuraea sp. NPDC049129 TaxID=3155272 RepID=UPI00340B2264